VDNNGGKTDGNDDFETQNSKKEEKVDEGSLLAIRETPVIDI
jgi:hypothetical protein